MTEDKKVYPSGKLHFFRKRNGYHSQYFCIKNVFKVLKQRKIAYPLALFLLALEVFGYVYSATGNAKIFNNTHPVVKTIGHASDLFLSASITIIILYLPKNGNNFYEFFTGLYPEGNKLLGPLLAMKKHHFWRNFLICNMCIGILVAVNASFFLINFGWNWYKYHIFKDIEFYFYNLVLLMLLALARKLELLFLELNELLEYKTEHFLNRNNNRKDQDVLENQLNFILESKHFYSVRTFRIMHYDLCKHVKRYNEMFGRIILGLFVFSILNILAKVTTILDLVVTRRDDEGKNIRAVYMGTSFLWIFIHSGLSFLFAYYGEQITKEGEKTTKICFYLLNKVPFHPKNDDEKLVQEELQILAFQSYSNIPCLSVGDFFNINFKVLGLMISSITSYLLVIIQFLLRPQN